MAKLKKIKGRAWRVGMPETFHGKTAQDIIDFETYELGNKHIGRYAKKLGIDLTQISSNDVVWLCPKKSDARYYSTELTGDPYLYDIPPNSFILADDNQGGYLVWIGGKKRAKPNPEESYEEIPEEQFEKLKDEVEKPTEPAEETEQEEPKEPSPKTSEQVLTELKPTKKKVGRATKGKAERVRKQRKVEVKLGKYFARFEESFTIPVKRWLASLKAEAMTKEGIKEEDLTVKIVDGKVVYPKKMLKANTYRNYASRIMYFMEWLVTPKSFNGGAGADPIRLIYRDSGESAVMAFREWIGTKISNAGHINMIFVAVRSLYDYIAALKRLESNPFAIIKGYPVAKKVTRRFLENAEVSRILETSTGLKQKHRIAILFGLYAGLRISEVVAIRKEDIHQEVVDEAKEEKGFYITVRGKGEVEREAQIFDDDIVDEIMDYIKTLKTDWVIPSNKPEIPLNQYTLSNSIQRFSKSINVDFSFHALRHTFATRLVNLGARIEDIKELLGHSSPATTYIYAKTSPETITKRVKGLRRELQKE